MIFLVASASPKTVSFPALKKNDAEFEPQFSIDTENGIVANGD